MATNAGMKAIAKEEKRLEKERKRQVELANKMLIPVSKKTLETLGLISFDPKGVFRLKENRWMSVFLIIGDFKALQRLLYVSSMLLLLLTVKPVQTSLKTEVLCMVKDVPANTIVTADNVKDYFAVVSVDMAAVPDNAYKQLSELPKDGFYIENAMSKSQMVFKDDIATVDAILDKYRHGYEITSFKVPDFTRGVNGCIRKGDIVDVYAVDPTTDMLILLAENVYVYEVYDSSGNKVTSKDEIATSFTVYVKEAEVENLNLAVCYGGIQMYLKTE